MAHVRLFNHYLPYPIIALTAIEAVLLYASLIIGHTLRFRLFGDVPWDTPLLLNPMLVPSAAVYMLLMLLCTMALGVYSAGLRGGNGPMAIRTVVAYCLLGTSALTVIYYLLPPLYMGRGVLFYATITALCLVVPVRWFLLRLVDAESLRSRVLIFGAGENARRLAEELGAGHAGVAKVVAFVQSSESEPVFVTHDLRSRTGTLLEMAQKLDISEIVVALDDRRAGQGNAFPLNELFECKLHGIRVSDAIGLCERELGVVSLAEISPSWLVFSSGFTSGEFGLMVKRASDIIMSFVLLLLTWPLMALAIVLIFCESGRPILYRQQRTGLEGKPFEILKFRSMVTNAEKEGAAVWAQKNDSRITRVGAFLRNTRIDELPQLWNVLRGDMSIVGPRPERPEFIQGLVNELPYYNERHHVKPGLMGWAQLNCPYGASVEDAAQKLRYDLYYVKNKSLMLDLIIMVQTVQVILLGMGVR